MKMKVTSGSLHIGLKTRPNYADASIFYQKNPPKKHTHISVAESDYPISSLFLTQLYASGTQ